MVQYEQSGYANSDEVCVEGKGAISKSADGEVAGTSASSATTQFARAPLWHGVSCLAGLVSGLQSRQQLYGLPYHHQQLCGFQACCSRQASSLTQ